MTTKIAKPQRTCVGCFRKFDQDHLLAITRLKGGVVVLNFEHSAAGRSVYLCCKAACFKKARNRKGKNGLEYGLKLKIAPQIWTELEAKCIVK